MLSAAMLAPRLGLTGVWLAMCGGICAHRLLFWIPLLHGKWLTRIL